MRPLPLATNTVGLLLLLLVTSICRLFWCTFINTTLLSLKKGKKFPDTEHDLTFKHLQLQFHNVARLNVWVAGLTLAILLVVVAWDSITSPYCSLFYINAILFFFTSNSILLFFSRSKVKFSVTCFPTVLITSRGSRRNARRADLPLVHALQGGRNDEDGKVKVKVKVEMNDEDKKKQRVWKVKSGGRNEPG